MMDIIQQNHPHLGNVELNADAVVDDDDNNEWWLMSKETCSDV